MSNDGFHVHGPHDHELEHAAQGGHNSHDEGGSMIGQIAVITAIIATIGAIFSYMGGATQADAGLYKNNAAIKKTEAANQWNYFQAKSTKQALAELALGGQRSRDRIGRQVDHRNRTALLVRYVRERRRNRDRAPGQSSDQPARRSERRPAMARRKGHHGSRGEIPGANLTPIATRRELAFDYQFRCVASPA